MAVHQITLKDCLERVEPPEKVLTIAVVDDAVFVSISQCTQDGQRTILTEIADIAVSSATLREALELLAADRVREDARPLDPPGNDQGTRAARLAGNRLSVAAL